MSATTHRIPRNTRRPLDFPIPVPDRASGKSDFHKTGAMIDRLMELQGQPLEPLQATRDAASAGVMIGSGPSQADLRPIRTRPGRKGSRPTKTAQKGTEGTTEGVVSVVSPAPPSDAIQEGRKGDSVANDPADDSEHGVMLDESNFDVTRHNGYITILNTQTGNHRTFRIETVTSEFSPLRGKRIVSLLTGADRENESCWKGFAFADDYGVKVWRRLTNTMNKSEFEKFANILENPKRFAERGLKFLAEGRCRRCNRPLTRPDSISTGYGATCAGIVGIKHEVQD